MSTNLNNHSSSSLTESGLQSISHQASKLQSSLKLILSSCPSTEEIHNLVKQISTEDLRFSLLNKPTFKSAVVLKTLYQQGKLRDLDLVLDPVYLADLNFEDAIHEGEKSSNSATNDHKYNGGTDTVEKKNVENINKATQIFESPFEIASKAASSFPPALPKIKSKSLEAKVYTHKSLKNSDESSAQAIAYTNERLEFLGDSVLNNLTTQLLYKWFPLSNEGQLTVFRSSLVCNAQLLEWSKIYGLDAKLKVSKSIRDSDLDTKRHADVLEAYIGALAEESIVNDPGYLQIKLWLANLCIPKVKQLLEYNNPPDRDIHNVSSDLMTASNTLYSLIGSAEKPPIYETKESRDASGVIFNTIVKFNGETLGKGSAKNIKESKRIAAKDVLDNHMDLVNKYYKQRQQIPKPTFQGKRQIEPSSESGPHKKHDTDFKFPLQVHCSVSYNEKDFTKLKNKVDSLCFRKKIPFVKINLEQTRDDKQNYTCTVKNILLASCVSHDKTSAKCTLLSTVQDRIDDIVQYLATNKD